MKTTLNPFENAKRTAQGTGGGVSPAVIEEMQAEISILGSQNETQAQDITDIKAQLEELAGAYSTTEHKTGRKWVDGKDIYEKAVDIGTLPNETEKAVSHNISYDTVISMLGSAKKNDGVTIPLPCVSTTPSNCILLSINSETLKIESGTDRTAFSGIVTITYTKPAQE